jgi:Protein of unknown function (DUF3788)
MLENAFTAKKTQPTPKELGSELGPATELWNQLVADITEECGITAKEWNSYSPKAGWSLRLKHKKRNIVYLAPCHGCFRVAFVLGDEAMKAARNMNFPGNVAKIIKDAVRYPEGSAIRLEIKSAEDTETVKKLAKIKVES